MSSLDKAEAEAKAAKETYKQAYADYLVAEPGRDLTVKQGHMHTCRVAFLAALMNFFDEYENSGVL